MPLWCLCCYKCMYTLFRGKDKLGMPISILLFFLHINRERECVCVGVCVGVYLVSENMCYVACKKNQHSTASSTWFLWSQRMSMQGYIRWSLTRLKSVQFTFCRINGTSCLYYVHCTYIMHGVVSTLWYHTLIGLMHGFVYFFLRKPASLLSFVGSILILLFVRFFGG